MLIDDAVAAMNRHGGQGEAILSWLPGQVLPQALRTGNPLLDTHHQQLQACLFNLRRICTFHRDALPDCAQCQAGSRDHCEGSLIALLGDLLAFIVDHFLAESELMRERKQPQWLRQACERHMQDHADISARVQQFIGQLGQRDPVVLIQELDAVLRRWMEHHHALHREAATAGLFGEVCRQN